MPHSAASYLGLHFLLCPTKRTLGLYGLISFILDFQICLTSFLLHIASDLANLFVNKKEKKKAKASQGKHEDSP